MTTQNVTEWRGQELLDNDGEKIGKIEEIYLDTDTDQPEWALVKTGLFGGKGTFVPLQQANPTGDGVQVPFEKSHVKDAPNIDPDGELSRSEERTLYEHYGLGYDDSSSGSGTRTGTTGNGDGGYDRDRGDAEGTVGRDTSGPTTDDAMTRSEEELQGRHRRARDGQGPPAQVRRHRGGREDGPRAPRGGPRRARADHRGQRRRRHRRPRDLRGGARGHAPRRGGRRREARVPKERVRLDKDVVEEEQQVSETVSKEQIEVDGAEERR